MTARLALAAVLGAALVAPVAPVAPALADGGRDRGRDTTADRTDRADRAHDRGRARDQDRDADADADADRDTDADDSARDRDAEQLVVVNALPELDPGQVARLRRALESRGLLRKLPDPIEAALEGRTKLSVDIDPIRDAYAEFDYDRAERLIDDQENQILDDAVAGDPTTALAELTLWRGLLAAAEDRHDEAIEWFRGAYRLNSALRIDPKFASPSVRQLVKQARREAEDTGGLRIESDPAEASVAIDGGEARPIGKELELEIGLHLVVITAPERAPYAEMIEIRPGKTEDIEIKLDPETKVNAAARLVDQTAAAAPGKARLKRAKALSRITGAKRILVVEDGSDDHVTLRLYDVDSKRVSKQFDLSGAASTTSIARIVQAALDSDDNVLDGRVDGGGSHPWYKRWYVWAAVGAVVVGGGVFAYSQMNHEPTAITGF